MTITSQIIEIDQEVKTNANILAFKTKPFDVTGRDKSLKINFGNRLANRDPACIQIQIAWDQNREMDAGDNFAVLVTERSSDFVKVNLHRVDHISDPSHKYIFYVLVIVPEI